jgi:hypothetical protein
LAQPADAEHQPSLGRDDPTPVAEDQQFRRGQFQIGLGGVDNPLV